MIQNRRIRLTILNNKFITMKAEKLKIDNEDLNLPYTTMDVLLLSNIVYIEDLFNCSYDDLLSVK